MDARLLLFGPFAVVGEGAPPAVRGAIPQAILARLALAGGPMSADALIGDLWQTPTDAVLSSLRAHISRLRARGWGDVLHGGRDGYALALAPERVDVLEYERLIAGAVPGERAEVLAAADALWRGAPLAWAGEFPFTAGVVRRLEAARRAARIELATLRMHAGDPVGVVEALAEQAASAPDDEDVVALLATALARSGRTSDAIAALDAFARAADADHARGLDELRQSIVRQDPVVLGIAPAGAEPTVERAGIPIPLTRFVGRSRELESVRRGRADSRLVTLTGAAGVGKTRLAVEVARRAGHSEDEAQWLVDLAAVVEPDDVVPALAEVTGAAEPTVDAVVQIIAGRRGLLILDNAEHVLGAVAAVCSALLERCAGLNVIVTSRESMRMAGERVLVIEPLLGGQVDEAVDLFLQRATDSSGVVEWDDAQRASVRALCARLDGLPLAIELAASRLDVLTLAELADSLARPGAVSTAGRHDSIESAIAWSVRLTSADETRMLSQLAAFAGTFTLEMVAGICDAGDADAREIAVSLARKSLISTVSGARERRFRMLESVRHYVRATLPLDDEAAWSRRHAAWLAGYAERLAPRLRTAQAKATRGAIAAARPDLDAAIAWAIDAGERAIAVRLVGALAWYWHERGAGADTISLIERALALPGDPLPDAEANALRAATFIASAGLEAGEVRRYVARLGEAAARAADPLHPMLAGAMRAHVASSVGDEDTVDEALRTAADHREQVGDAARWAVADYLLVRGDALRQLGRPAQALDALGECYRLATEAGDAWALRGACYVTGRTLISVRRPADALPVLRTGAISSLEIEDAAGALAAVDVFAAALVQLDRPTRAAELFGAVDALGERYTPHHGGSGGTLTADARERARQALTAEQWQAAVEAGRRRDLRWVMSNLHPAP
ncbi:BTAD domain-containing putative transcriptional regulator [Microbacterium awajiense]|uniref:BTAD domain-containing putative transcriptional regulator n=1 Tax=Microbacterium awajiense TaxID=415214 RepID=A0ABP7AHH2_9MICO